MATNRAERISRAIEKYGSTVTLVFAPTQLDAADDGYGDDWPSLTEPPTVAAPTSVDTKAVIVPLGDVEWMQVSNVGRLPAETANAYFKHDRNLNNVVSLIWRGNTYAVLQQDQFELADAVVVQQCLISRNNETIMAPYG